MSQRTFWRSWILWRWGWPVQTLPGGHLHPLVAPLRVAAAVDELLRQQLDRPSA